MDTSYSSGSQQAYPYQYYSQQYPCPYYPPGSEYSGYSPGSTQYPYGDYRQSPPQPPPPGSSQSSPSPHDYYLQSQANQYYYDQPYPSPAAYTGYPYPPRSSVPSYPSQAHGHTPHYDSAAAYAAWMATQNPRGIEGDTVSTGNGVAGDGVSTSPQSRTRVDCVEVDCMMRVKEESPSSTLQENKPTNRVKIEGQASSEDIGTLGREKMGSPVSEKNKALTMVKQASLISPTSNSSNIPDNDGARVPQAAENREESRNASPTEKQVSEVTVVKKNGAQPYTDQKPQDQGSSDDSLSELSEVDGESLSSTSEPTGSDQEQSTPPSAHASPNHSRSHSFNVEDFIGPFIDPNDMASDDYEYTDSGAASSSSDERGAGLGEDRSRQGSRQLSARNGRINGRAKKRSPAKRTVDSDSNSEPSHRTSRRRSRVTRSMSKQTPRPSRARKQITPDSRTSRQSVLQDWDELAHLFPSGDDDDEDDGAEVTSRRRGRPPSNKTKAMREFKKNQVALYEQLKEKAELRSRDGQVGSNGNIDQEGTKQSIPAPAIVKSREGEGFSFGARFIRWERLDERDRSGRTFLFKAASRGDYELCRTLVEAGADVHPKDNAGWTALHEACLEGHLSIASLLIQHGADVNVPGDNEDTPLHDAVQRGHQEVVECLLLHGASINAKNADGETPFTVADENMKNVIKDWLDKAKRVLAVDKAGRTPLHDACADGDLMEVRRNLSFGADINWADNAGWTPLHEAALAGHEDCVQELLTNGAEINALGFGNDTPLHDAAANSHQDVVRLLLEYGADPTRKNLKGALPVDLAKEESIKELLCENPEKWKPYKTALKRPMSALQQAVARSMLVQNADALKQASTGDERSEPDRRRRVDRRSSTDSQGDSMYDRQPSSHGKTKSGSASEKNEYFRHGGLKETDSPFQSERDRRKFEQLWQILQRDESAKSPGQEGRIPRSDNVRKRKRPSVGDASSDDDEPISADATVAKKAAGSRRTSGVSGKRVGRPPGKRSDKGKSCTPDAENGRPILENSIQAPTVGAKDRKQSISVTSVAPPETASHRSKSVEEIVRMMNSDSSDVENDTEVSKRQRSNSGDSVSLQAPPATRQKREDTASYVSWIDEPLEEHPKESQTLLPAMVPLDTPEKADNQLIQKEEAEFLDMSMTNGVKEEALTGEKKITQRRKDAENVERVARRSRREAPSSSVPNGAAKKASKEHKESGRDDKTRRGHGDSSHAPKSIEDSPSVSAKCSANEKEPSERSPGTTKKQRASKSPVRKKRKAAISKDAVAAEDDGRKGDVESRSKAEGANGSSMLDEESPAGSVVLSVQLGATPGAPHEETSAPASKHITVGVCATSPDVPLSSYKKKRLSNGGIPRISGYQRATGPDDLRNDSAKDLAPDSTTVAPVTRTGRIDPIREAAAKEYRLRRCLPLYAMYLTEETVESGEGGTGTMTSDRPRTRARWMVDMQIGLLFGYRNGRELLDHYQHLTRRVANSVEKDRLEKTCVAEAVFTSMVHAKPECVRWAKTVEIGDAGSGRKGLRFTYYDVNFLREDEVLHEISGLRERMKTRGEWLEEATIVELDVGCGGVGEGVTIPT
ncbi:hypothetical protein, variant [Spizellomyces punctatus DAOM BR117]|uniref:Uncharacterized protein n=1 Tax=Spizellomyces punctatus (strain DAOM BR117) TaxID=645134 RepID=A0A0L0H5F4_SPIPD|nr:hypothetical protein, variant [Spizellomyces punctatus DAOM BR117]KNC96126.1 hypothetical protein, variant [Spizellomyces punctatus DAOM BR117]|eukprot:XP_016604166.1 hypothetical protein, variant [Spizellomyces punctatus DAOM BR117]